LLNHVVIVVKLYYVEALWKIDVQLLSTLVNTSLITIIIICNKLLEHI